MYYMIIYAALATPSLTQSSVVGYFDPYAPFPSPLERAEFAQALGAALSEPDVNIRGSAYSKAIDLARDMGAGRVQIAMVSPQFLWVSKEKAYARPNIAAIQGKSSNCQYSLYTRQKDSVKDLRQLRKKRLAVVKTGVRDKAFIYNILLKGEIRESKYFKLLYVPDLAGALGTLRFGKADAFFGPDLNYNQWFSQPALTRIARVGTAICPLVVFDRRLEPAQKALLTEKLIGGNKRLIKVLRRVGLSGFTSLPSSALSGFETALVASTKDYGRAVPRFLYPSLPSEKRVSKTIEAYGVKVLPDPSLLIVEDSQ